MHDTAWRGHSKARSPHELSMKTQLKSLLLPLLLLVLLSPPNLASAYYDPGVQRWINRDPVGERGGRNLYGFTANAPVARGDRDGYIWIVTGKPPPDNDSTVVCRRGRPVPRVVSERPAELLARLQAMVEGQKKDNAKPIDPDAEVNGYICAQRCAYQHEQSHIKDILAQNPNICVGVQDGIAIGSNDPNSELLNSEQRAHQVEADCLAGCKKKCPSDVVNDRIDKNDKWIREHQYE